MSRHTLKHVLSRQRGGTEPLGDATGEEPNQSLSPELIAIRAYELWRRRGSPVGSTEADWLEAERQLKQRTAGPFME
jgi:hypothetical protein